MSIVINRILGIAALAGLMGAASMQASVQATFHLPVAAHWGSSLLAPGDYKIMVRDLSVGPNQIVIEGQGHRMYQLVRSADELGTPQHSSLQLVELGGTYFVKEYRSVVAGKTYTFGVPKGATAHHGKSIELAN